MALTRVDKNRLNVIVICYYCRFHLFVFMIFRDGIVGVGNA